MDSDNVNPVALDVSHQVDNLSFRFYTATEARRISVRRLTSPFAFDELGRAIAGGLYDPALGPTSYAEGPCRTCGLTYDSCPGHFGHIELPFPLPNPLLANVLFRLLKSSCWSCQAFLLPNDVLDACLARLYFEDAGLPNCARAVQAFETFKGDVDSYDTMVVTVGEVAAKKKNPFVANWSEFLNSMPHPVSKYLEGIDHRDIELVQKRILYAAKVAWKKAKQNGDLLSKRSKGWREVRDIIVKSDKTCSRCDRKPVTMRRTREGLLFKNKPPHETLVTPSDMATQVRALWVTHTELLELLYGLKGRNDNKTKESPMHMRLFVSIVLVPPSRFRPSSMVGDMSYAAEHPQNIFYNKLLTEMNIIMKANEVGTRDDKTAQLEQDDGDEPMPDDRPTKTRVAQAAANMQDCIKNLYDSSGMKNNGKVLMTGIRQQLEAKAGLFRQHMMGKRVNFSCRSVIGPDVFLDTNEIGIPLSFAKHLTVPETVTPANLQQMRQAILNGPDVYPGATAVEDWNNGEHRVIKFRSSQDRDKLKAQASLLMQNRMPHRRRKDKDGHFLSGQFYDDTGLQTADAMPKRVYRHLRSGDIVLFNRQPTLHRVSIMAHRVRVLPGDRTLRFHYANCNSYNADFDGDEMNVHVPQDYVARAEAEELMLCSNHYIVPTSGAPVRGLIQDHIAAATLISRRDRFFNREKFCQLVYTATENLMMRPHMVNQKYELPLPAILKPVPLWTGKQLISTILTVIRAGRPGINLEATSKTKANIVGKEEASIIVRRGELLRGVIDKSSLGASMFGIVHAVQEAYGCDASDDFLSCMSRLCLFFLRMHGHTTGVEDLLLQKEGDRRRQEILQEPVRKVGIEVTNEVYAQLNKEEGENQRRAKSETEARAMVEEMIRRDGIEAEDRLDTAMKSALNSVSSNVMQTCIPGFLSKAFPANGFSLMTSTGAKGSPVNAAQISCLLGSTSLEGKRVPRMGGSGATLPCFVPFDPSPVAGGFIASRFLTGITPQEFFFHAMSGREGLLDTSLKTANSGYLQRCLIKHMEGVRLHYDGTVRDSDSSVLQFIYGDDGIDPSKSRWTTEQIDWQVSNKTCFPPAKARTDPDVEQIRKEDALWRGAEISPNGTVMERVSPAAMSKRGAVSEKYNEAIRKVSESYSDSEEVRNFLESRYQAAALDPGEAVGVIAAQGVGEPSTQMTLNTFHHAGSSSAHVTLGIPRLRELLMQAAKYPKTPSMTLPIQAKHAAKAAKELKRKLQNVTLSDLLLQIEVHELGASFVPTMSDWALRRVKLRVCLPPEELYKDALGFGFETIKTVFRKAFVSTLHNRLKIEVRRLANEDCVIRNMRTGAASSYVQLAVKPEWEEEEELAVFDGEFPRSEVQTEKKEDADDDVMEGNETQMSEGDASSSDEETDDDASNDGDVKEKANDAEKQSGDEDEAQYDEFQAKQARLLSGNKAAGQDRKKKKSKKSTSKKRPRINPEDNDAEMRDQPGSNYGVLGYQIGSFGDVNNEAIDVEWVLPADLSGRMNIASIMKETAEVTKIMHVKRITKCFIDDSNGQYSVITEGSNLRAVMRLGENLINFNRLETNDMFGILHTYGVEALRAALIAEFAKVFEAYGIPVNTRHLSLIADYMTAYGEYRGFNRLHMQDTPSALQRMTFETSVKFLTESALNNTMESGANPSAAIAMGQVYSGGTGGFELLHNVHADFGEVSA